MACINALYCKVSCIFEHSTKWSERRLNTQYYMHANKKLQTKIHSFTQNLCRGRKQTTSCMKNCEPLATHLPRVTNWLNNHLIHWLIDWLTDRLRRPLTTSCTENCEPWATNLPLTAMEAQPSKYKRSPSQPSWLANTYTPPLCTPTTYIPLKYSMQEAQPLTSWADCTTYIGTTVSDFQLRKKRNFPNWLQSHTRYGDAAISNTTINTRIQCCN